MFIIKLKAYISSIFFHRARVLFLFYVYGEDILESAIIGNGIILMMNITGSV